MTATTGILTGSGLECTVQVIDYENDYLDQIGQASIQFLLAGQIGLILFPKWRLECLPCSNCVRSKNLSGRCPP
jgi:hypothetical protein